VEYPEHIDREATGGTIYVVVAVFNRIFFTRRFLECMRNQTFSDFEVIVVDDGSTDGTAEVIAEHYKEVQLLRGDGNLWWTGATNLGIRHAMIRASEGETILVINDDLEVNPDYLERLHELHMAIPKALIGSVVVDINNPGVIVDGGRTVNWWSAQFNTLNYNRQLSEFDADYCVDVSLLTGWGTLIPISVFREIGFYDDRHFQQCGDTELTVRASHVGYPLILSYAAIAKVYVDATDAMNTSTYYSLRHLKRYFFDIKSNYRLKYRLFFSLNTAKHPVACISFMICDLLRISWHFLSRLRV
jgi:N-acetylglucosaminyl-diphospho-decaprenol L-rhamnosyltransferase